VQGAVGGTRYEAPERAASALASLAWAVSRMKTSSILQRLLGAKVAPRAPLPSRAATGSARRAIALCHNLISERGEVSGARLARDALTAYASLDTGTVAIFFDLLIEEFSPDPEVVGRCAERYR